MKATLRAVMALCLLCCLCGAAMAASESGVETAVVKLDSGMISGETDGDIHVFRGIPYAAPPVGELRWRPPQPPQPWIGIRASTQFGPSCPQPQESRSSVYSEDCLYLNIWTPAPQPQAKLPVMFWIHGGGFNFGGTSLPEYEGKNLAAKGVVVVTVNYRLGPLGFLVHPLLDKESTSGTSGNYGLLDQIAALKWVQRNIEAFGGDPAQVTIFGQSAGSRSVSLLLMSPLAKGLFKGAIAESGGPIIGSEYLSPAFNGDKVNVGKMGQALARRLGSDQATDVLADMRDKSAEEVVRAAACSTGLFDDGLFFAPVFDNWVLPDDPRAALREGRIHAVPVITGSTRNEGALYLTQEKEITRQKYQDYFSSRFGQAADSAMKIFPALRDEDIGPAIDKVIAVGANARPAQLTAQAIQQKGMKSYIYQFTRASQTALARKAGAHHGVELAYVFGNMKEADGYDVIDRKLSQLMMQYWVNFAKTGNPNGAGLPDWPEYSAREGLNLEFGDQLKIGSHLFKREIDFIGQVDFLNYPTVNKGR
ncbi:MAG TPA: carboxylesterase family protein [Negativicutes bacterium]|nr:carboxylesterase family protein [Negativicutes bacterium]